ncbi:hypothetical protein SAMN05443637_1267 [Pseudonocardia thermophila]|uniref:ABC-2 family transporter protein n=1 Tax=Pseudonocardia thermophila TaxID=1848 RepID=A0A1M7A4V0_PSETH|nr:hypothetical protein [Pseudonocardia thermophila]SHL37603.1 hypothetical protein SAMN05443637_1267 [Pseudonocardia thermophila]
MTVVRSELVKALTVRSGPALALVAVGAAVVLAAVFVASLPITQHVSVAGALPAEVVSAALVGIDVTAVVLTVLGALVGGAEHATGTVVPTYLLTPRRTRVVVAKAVVVGAIAVVVAAVAAVLCAAVGQGALLLAGSDPVPIDGTLLRSLAGNATGPVLYAVAGLAGAVLTRSTGGGVAGALGLLLVPAVVGWFPGLSLLAPLLPAAAVHGLSGVADPAGAEYLAAAPAALLLVGWLTGMVGTAAWRAEVRDA